MRAAVLALIAGCGRFDFVEVVVAGGDAPASGDAAPVADFVAAMPCETDIAIGSVPAAIDQLVWSDFGAQQVVYAIHHLDASHHEVHAHVLSVASGHIVVGPDVTSYAAPDLTSLSVVPAPSGATLVVHDIASGTLRVVAVDHAFAMVSEMSLPLADSYVPYARAGAAQMVVGINGGGVVAYAVDAALAITGGPYTIDSTADTPTHPSIGTLGSDFVIGWSSYSANTCKFVRVDAAGSFVSPVVTLALAAGNACDYGAAAGIGAGAAIYAIQNTTTYEAYAGAFDTAFTTPTPPLAIGGADSLAENIADDTTRALVAVRTNGDSRIASVQPDGSVAMLGSDFGLNGSDSDAETIHPLAGAIVHARSEAGMLHVRKLCR
jgi:hypothetical protein